MLIIKIFIFKSIFSIVYIFLLQLKKNNIIELVSIKLFKIIKSNK